MQKQITTSGAPWLLLDSYFRHSEFLRRPYNTTTCVILLVGAREGGGANSFVASLSRSTIDHASLPRRSIVPTPHRNTPNISVLITSFPHFTGKSCTYLFPVVFRRLLLPPLVWPPFSLHYLMHLLIPYHLCFRPTFPLQYVPFLLYTSH